MDSQINSCTNNVLKDKNIYLHRKSKSRIYITKFDKSLNASFQIIFAFTLSLIAQCLYYLLIVQQFMLLRSKHSSETFYMRRITYKIA